MDRSLVSRQLVLLALVGCMVIGNLVFGPGRAVVPTTALAQGGDNATVAPGEPCSDLVPYAMRLQMVPYRLSYADQDALAAAYAWGLKHMAPEELVAIATAFEHYAAGFDEFPVPPAAAGYHRAQQGMVAALADQVWSIHDGDPLANALARFWFQVELARLNRGINSGLSQCGADWTRAGLPGQPVMER